MWIPEFLMVYKIRGWGRAGGGVMSRVGNDRVHGNLTGGEEARGGGSPVGKRRGEDAGGGGGEPPDTIASTFWPITRTLFQRMA